MKSTEFVCFQAPPAAAVSNHPEVGFADYERRLKWMQDTLQLVQQAYLGTQERAVVVLEGWDTAGKGGVVRRCGWVLDPRSFKVHPIAAPSSQEQAQHYLQRFWQRLPEHGQIVVFDRSWYGRVRSSGSIAGASNLGWKRAYREIDEFERALVADGIRLVKAFLHITPEEQIRRFKDRLTNPRKRWKLSFEDFRNRARWTDYEAAIEEMMGETFTKPVPWYLVTRTTSRTGGLPCSASLSTAWGREWFCNRARSNPKVAKAGQRDLLIRRSWKKVASSWPGEPRGRAGRPSARLG